jgi:hypothetical protein
MKNILACQVQQSIDKIWTELGDKPLVVDNLIKFLNTISWDELKTLGVNERTTLIMDATRVLTKKQLVQNAQLCAMKFLRVVNYLEINSDFNSKGNTIILG